MDRPTFEMFFYGTLKSGQRNHGYCRGARRVRGASVRGDLYDLPEGYPALVVPEQDILVVGTKNHLLDAGKGHDPEWREASAPEGATVFGELYAFDDPAERLPAIDRLEEFVPGDQASPYRRVLIPARTDTGTTLAWAYVARDPGGTHLPGGSWPA